MCYYNKNMKIKMTGNNILWRNFYDPVRQNDITLYILKCSCVAQW